MSGDHVEEKRSYTFRPLFGSERCGLQRVTQESPHLLYRLLRESLLYYISPWESLFIFIRDNMVFILLLALILHLEPNLLFLGAMSTKTQRISVIIQMLNGRKPASVPAQLFLV